MPQTLVKKLRKIFPKFLFFKILILIILLNIQTSCAHSKKENTNNSISDFNLNFAKKIKPKILKKYDNQANILHIHCTQDGSKILVSTNQHKIKKHERDSLLTLYTQKGKKLWQKWIPNFIRAQSISPLGNYLAISYYDDKTKIFDILGNTILELNFLSKPFFTSDEKKIILFFDDDSEKIETFKVYDLNTKKEIFSEKQASNTEAIFAEIFRLKSNTDLLTIYDTSNTITIFNPKNLTTTKFKPNLPTYFNNLSIKILNEKELAILAHEKNQTYIFIYNLETKNKILEFKLNENFNYFTQLNSNDFLFYTNQTSGQKLLIADIKNKKIKLKKEIPIPMEYTFFPFFSQTKNTPVYLYLLEENLKLVQMNENLNLNLIDFNFNSENIYASCAANSEFLAIGYGPYKNGSIVFLKTNY
jgi:hypothetical protein